MSFLIYPTPRRLGLRAAIVLPFRDTGLTPAVGNFARVAGEGSGVSQLVGLESYHRCEPLIMRETP